MVVKNENYVTIQGWMVNELGLKGNGLLVYAVIYGFSQDDDQWFSGSRQYLADWINGTKRTIEKTLASLVEAGLLEKKSSVINGVKFCSYRAKKVRQGGEESSVGVAKKVRLGSEESSPNNIDISISNNNKDIDIAKKAPDSSESDHGKDVSYYSVVDMYNDICVSFPKVTVLSDARKTAIKARFNSGYNMYDFKRLFELAEASSFLKGSNNKNWSATFDWLIKDANMAKVLDGNYNDKVPARPAPIDYGDPMDFYG